MSRARVRNGAPREDGRVRYENRGRIALDYSRESPERCFKGLRLSKIFGVRA